jgi:hypothetical protein
MQKSRDVRFAPLATKNGASRRVITPTERGKPIVLDAPIVIEPKQ